MPLHTHPLREAGNKAHTIPQRDRSVSFRYGSRFILFVVMTGPSIVIFALISAAIFALLSVLIRTGV